MQWEGEGQFVPFGADNAGPWQGFQAWRADFDAILLNRARELGVQVLQPCQALQPLVNHSRVIGVMTSVGMVQSAFVIDATGGQHWLARQLGLRIAHYSPRLIAHYGYVEGECPDRDRAPALIADKQGWLWTAKVHPQLYQWTRLAFEQQRIAKNWLPVEFHGLKPRGKARGADVTWRAVTEPAGPGYFIVGDAAAVLDPASSHGVLKAIMSGMMAGHSLAQVLKHGQPEHLAIKAYGQWVQNWLKHDLEKLRELYAILPNPPYWI